MTTIYIPRTITSAEEAEALPEGTPIWDERPERRRASIARGYAVTAFGKRAFDVGILRYFPNEVVGWTALIPTDVDAEPSQPLGTTRHGAELIARRPFTIYIDYQETS